MSTTPTVHLQSIGLVPAKPAGELVPGDRTLWNFGYVETVIEVKEASTQFIRVKVESAPTRTNPMRFQSERRMKKSRLVGLAGPL